MILLAVIAAIVSTAIGLFIKNVISNHISLAAKQVLLLILTRSVIILSTNVQWNVCMPKCYGLCCKYILAFKALARMLCIYCFPKHKIAVI